MPWYFMWSDFIKKRACRYLLQHYLGNFLREKLTLDQLSVDIYNGTGKIEDLELDMESLNEALETFSVPVRIEDGFIGSITVTIPWSSLISDNMVVEVSGLEVTLTPKQRLDNSNAMEAMINSMSSVSSIMTSSLQLAKECLKAEKADAQNDAQKYDGLEKFAWTIDSVISRVKLTFVNTVIRMEHIPRESETGIALELRIDRIEYYDDMAVDQGSPVDDPNRTNVWEPAAIANKNIHIMGANLYLDECSRYTKINRQSSRENNMQNMDSLGCSSSFTSSPSSPDATESLSSESKSSAFLFGESKPIKIAVLPGRQDVKVKLKQNDAVGGPKLDVDFTLTALHVLLSPQQVHKLIELANGMAFPAAGDEQSHSNRNKPMGAQDFRRVEHELQRELYSSRVPHVAYHDDIMVNSLESTDDLYYSMAAGHGPRSQMTDMESSFSSNYSNRSNCTLSSARQLPKESKRSHRNSYQDSLHKLLDDPAAELTRYRLKVGFISLSVLHENPTHTPGDQLSPGVPASEKLTKLSDAYFTHVKSLSTVGVGVDLRGVREKFSEACPQNHIGCLGKPLTIECTQKTASSYRGTDVEITVGLFEVVECLYDKNNSTCSTMGFSLPIDNKLPEYSELLTFRRDVAPLRTQAMFASMPPAGPNVRIKLYNHEKFKSSRRSIDCPKTEVHLELDRFDTEIDITIVDRISSLLKPEPSSRMDNGRSAMFTTVNPYSSGLGQNYFSQALDEGPAMNDHKTDIRLSCPSARLFLRFPIPDLRSGHQTDRPWWIRMLRRETLILDLEGLDFQTSMSTSEACQTYELTCREIQAFFQQDPSKVPVSFAHISQDGDEDRGDNFNLPRLEITTYPMLNSVLDDEALDSMDSRTPVDSLNGACQFDKAEPSPFSNRRSMYEKEEMGEKSEVKHTSEEMVVPADRDEMRLFQDKAAANTKMAVSIYLPNLNAVFPDKDFFELLYNRISNDLLLWQPMAPSPMCSQDQLPPLSLDFVLQPLQQMAAFDKFESCRSANQYVDSDSDDDNQYTIHDTHRARRPLPPRQLQSKLCVNINIGRGRLSAHMPVKDDDGEVMKEHHGELLILIDDATLFIVANHGGDPDLQYLCFQANKVNLYHHGFVDKANVPIPQPVGRLQQFAAIPSHLEQTLAPTDSGIGSKLSGNVACGGDSQDMLTVSVKIKLDNTFKNVKDYVLAVGMKGATLHHRMAPNGQSWISQAIDLLDLTDFPVSGYSPPKVVTELHVHMWSCAVDYRPLYLPLKAVLTAEAFTVSSNIVAESTTSLLRFILDDSALYVSDKCQIQSAIPNLRQDYVCVADMERFELSLKSSDGKDQRFPKTDLRVSNNRLNVRTCSDSCKAFMELIQYFAGDKDLKPPSENATPTNSIHGESFLKEALATQITKTDLDDDPMSSSNDEQVNTLMADAMQESSAVASMATDSDSDNKPNRPTIYFVPQDGVQQPDFPPGLRHITVSQSDESEKMGQFSDDDEFCIIDDPGLGISPRDGEPTIRAFTNVPIEIIDNHFEKPLGRADQLKAPEHFPSPEQRYTLKEITVVWSIYGGRDFGAGQERNEKGVRSQSPSEKIARTSHSQGYGHHPASEYDRRASHSSWQSRGGPGRDLDVLMEVQLTKVRMQHESYPETSAQASRQVLLVHDLEVRDRLRSSQINKFLYQYTSESMPRQTHANMVLLKAVHSRPDPSVSAQECSMKVSLLPLRLNVDQDSLYFLKQFFMELAGENVEETKNRHLSDCDSKTAAAKLPSSPPPVMTVGRDSPAPEEVSSPEPLIMFDEIAQDQESITEDDDPESIISAASKPPTFFKSFVFSPEVLIRLDYHGKRRVDMEQGTLAGLLAGLTHLNCSELRLKRLNYKHGLLGVERVLMFAITEWLSDIKRKQLPSILGGVGPMHSFVQLAQGIKDLFWLPIEQYRKDGRIVRGLQRGAASFTMSTAMAVLELTNRLVQSIQYVAEMTYDMLSPGPSVRQHAYRQNMKLRRSGHPADMREGITNAYIVVREGISETANNIISGATVGHNEKGMTGAVGGVLRQIPPTVLQPFIIASEATSNVLGGMRNQLVPDARKEDQEKWKLDLMD